MAGPCLGVAVIIVDTSLSWDGLSVNHFLKRFYAVPLLLPQGSIYAYIFVKFVFTLLVTD